MNNSKIKQMYRQMCRIRFFEMKLEALFKKGVLIGTIHCCIGQEAVAVGIINALSKNDIITGNHRSHGHYLAYTNDFEGLMAEIMGKADGIVGGRGGSQHLHHGNFYSNGVQGCMVPVATGMAWAEKIKNTGNIVLCLIGDGTLGQGVVYESLNMAGLWKLPIVYIVENNYYAMSTPVHDAVAGSILERGRVFGCESSEIFSHDVEEIHNSASHIVNRARNNHGPQYCVVNTYRFCGHSKSDDRCYRSEEEEKEWSNKDPLCFSSDKIPQKEQANIQEKARLYIKEIEEKVSQFQPPLVNKLFEGGLK